MAKRRLTAFWRKPANKFLVSLVAFVVCSWLIYHGFSAITGPIPDNSQAMSVNISNDPGYDPLVVARVKPHERTVIANPPDTQLPLLAAETTPAAPQTPVKKPDAEQLTEEVEAAVRQAKQLLESGKVIQARTQVNAFLTKHGHGDACQPVEELALQLGRKTILSPEPYGDDHLCYAYTVKSGDILSKLAAPCEVPYQCLCRINNIRDPRLLRAGQSLKLVRGPVNAVIVKHKFKIYLYLQDTLFAAYRIGLGKDGSTAEGTWLVEDRVRKPTYRDPDTGQIHAGNDPANPTGGYWIRLKGLSGEALGKTGFGIHGTIEPESIGKSISRGCIRMLNEDVVQAFDMLQPGASKVITKP